MTAIARAMGYRSAWADPEHVRLAMYRSWWDATVGPVERLKQRDDQDPWLLSAPQVAVLALPPGRVLLALPAGTAAAA